MGEDAIFQKDEYFIVAVSDVHIGHTVFGDNSAKTFGEFLETLENHQNLKIEHFVILGDFLDLWRDNDEDLFRVHGNIFTRLGNLKGGKISRLHYVVGNHDFVIPDYQKEGDFKDLLTPFIIWEGSSVEPTPLELETNGVKFNLLHGHQDAFEGLAHLYDLSAVFLCGQDKEMGDFTSILYKYKFELVTVLSIIFSLFFLLTSNYLLAGVALVITAIISVLWFLHYQKHRKASRVLDYRQKPPKKRREESFRINPEDFEDIQQALEQRLDRLPKQYKDRRDKILEKYRKSTAVTTQVEPDGILVRGHTHDTEIIPNTKYNPGAWVEDYQYCILLIDRQGNVDMSKCKRAASPRSSS